MDGVTATDGGGAYWRDAEGTWRSTVGDDPVPGASDLRLADLYAPPLGPGERPDHPERPEHLEPGEAGEAAVRATGEPAPSAPPAPPEGAVRLVPRAWASRHPDHPLAWIYAYATLGAREDVAVPAAAWDERADTVVAMAAPELHPHNLVGVDAVATLLGVSPSTVRSYAARHQMPEPIVRVGGSPLWPRALIERWLPTRRRPRAEASGSPGSDGASIVADATTSAAITAHATTSGDEQVPRERKG